MGRGGWLQKSRANRCSRKVELFAGGHRERQGNGVRFTGGSHQKWRRNYRAGTPRDLRCHARPGHCLIEAAGLLRLDIAAEHFVRIFDSSPEVIRHVDPHSLEHGIGTLRRAEHGDDIRRRGRPTHDNNRTVRRDFGPSRRSREDAEKPQDESQKDKSVSRSLWLHGDGITDL